MEDVSAKIQISDIFLDESIYPRENIDHRRIGVFEENLRDGFVFQIGRAIGRSRQAVDKYIADLRATALFELDLKIFRLNQLGIPQDRIAKRVGLGQQRISRYLPQMPQVAKSVNSDLSKGFTVPQVAQKHGWPEPLVWSQAQVNADDLSRFKASNSR